MQSLERMVERLITLLEWTRYYAELSLLYAEDLTVYARRRHRFGDKHFRHLDEIDQECCYEWFGLRPYHLCQLYLTLRIPEVFRTSSGQLFSGEECFIITLFHMIKGSPFTAMAETFGGDSQDFSKMFDLMIDHLYYTFYNKISGTSLSQWIPAHLHRCRQLIFNAISEGGILETEHVNGEVVRETIISHHFDFNSFRPFGFLDDFASPTAQPGNSVSRRKGPDHDIQRAVYSGYLKRHVLKAQVVYLQYRRFSR